MKKPRSGLTLDKAMVQVLKNCENETAEHGYLTDEINRQKLYWQKDGTPLKVNQIGPRAKNHPELFEKIPKSASTKAKIRLR